MVFLSSIPDEDGGVDAAGTSGTESAGAVFKCCSCGGNIVDEENGFAANEGWVWDSESTVEVGGASVACLYADLGRGEACPHQSASVERDCEVWSDDAGDASREEGGLVESTPAFTSAVEGDAYNHIWQWESASCKCLREDVAKRDVEVRDETVFVGMDDALQDDRAAESNKQRIRGIGGVAGGAQHARGGRCAADGAVLVGTALQSGAAACAQPCIESVAAQAAARCDCVQNRYTHTVQ